MFTNHMPGQGRYESSTGHALSARRHQVISEGKTMGPVALILLAAIAFAENVPAKPDAPSAKEAVAGEPVAAKPQASEDMSAYIGVPLYWNNPGTAELEHCLTINADGTATQKFDPDHAVAGTWAKDPVSGGIVISWSNRSVQKLSAPINGMVFIGGRSLKRDSDGSIKRKIELAKLKIHEGFKRYIGVKLYSGSEYWGVINADASVTHAQYGQGTWTYDNKAREIIVAWVGRPVSRLGVPRENRIIASVRTNDAVRTYALKIGP